MTLSSDKKVVRHLAAHKRLYTSPPMSKLILRQYFDLPLEQLIPLSISHGIDFNHEKYPQDILNPEPIHWCYNEEIARRSASMKPCVRLPHPWLFLHRLSGSPTVSQNGKTLLIGPPPSATNDTNLFQSIQKAGFAPDAILVKARDETKTATSIGFWKGKGVVPVSAGAMDEFHYHRLMEILLSYECVVSPVFSSVTILASALGSKITMLRDYKYCSYSPVHLDFESILTSKLIRDLVFCYIEQGKYDIAKQRSLELLGAQFFNSDDCRAKSLDFLFKQVTPSLYVPAAARSRLSHVLLSSLARITGRSYFLRYGLIRALSYKLKGQQQDFVCKQINWVDAVVNGISDRNLRIRPLKPSERSVKSGQGADW